MKKKSKLNIFWEKLSHGIIDNRAIWLTVIGLITVFMAFQIPKLQLSYELPKFLPSSDSAYKIYETFKKRFGEDGNVMVIAVENPKLFDLKHFNDWYQLDQNIKREEGIKNVISVGTSFNIQVNEVKKRFETRILLGRKAVSQAEADSVRKAFLNLPFYRGFLYNGDVHLMAITYDQATINSENRNRLTDRLKTIGDTYEKQSGIKLHYSGLPFVRSNFQTKVRQELVLFMILAFLVTVSILYLFFRSLKVVFFSALVVLVGVIWSVGFIILFGYKMSILTGLIPPLVIVIGIPNTIFLINKYQETYLKTKKQVKAVKASIEKVGKTTFIANVTTFIGFFVFYFTGSPVLVEFGLVASMSVLTTWAISLVMIPTIFSYLTPPKARHVRHLENKNIAKVLNKIEHWVHHRRRVVYGVTAILTILGILGASRIQTISYVVDDLPKDDPIYEDLKFIEKHFKGIVPFEVSIDSKKESGIFDPIILNKIKVLQRKFQANPEFTKPVSVVEGLKFIYQAYRGGDAKYYRLPPALELQKLSEYVQDQKEKSSLLSGFLDADKQFSRISFQVQDAGTVRLKSLYESLQAEADTIFSYDVGSGKMLKENSKATLTGQGVLFTKGSDYLLRNLKESTLLAIILVAIVMATQFLNFRTILISTIPSIIPLMITAGLMGFFKIPLKPSTILIFSIAFGIASDGTIYFLTKYKDELLQGKSIAGAVSETIQVTGISMIYTAFILFFGFGIFVASGFNGTIFLGLLVSITLLISMISNLILLPCFLVSLDKRQQQKKNPPAS